MSNHQDAKRAFGKRWPLWFVVILAVYLFVIYAEETVYEKQKGQWTTYVGPNSALLYTINTLITDEQGRVWIGTEYGLYLLEPDGSWKTYRSKSSGLSTENVQALAMDKNGELWIGTNDGLYTLDTNGKWTTYFEHEFDGSRSHVKALVIDEMDRVWVGTFGGLRVFNPDGTETNYTKQNSGLIDNSVTALTIDQFGRIWVGTFGYGISVLDKDGHWITYQEESQRPKPEDDDVNIMLTDFQNRVWVGTGRGIKVISPNGHRTSYTGQAWGIMPSFSIYVHGLALDKQERMWIGIANKLVVVDEKSDWTAYTPYNSGLPDITHALVVDKDGKLWVGSWDGLSVVDLKNGLPETLPNSWLVLRAILRFPYQFAIAFGTILFYPFESTMGIYYFILLLLIILSPIGIRRGYREKKQYLLFGSLLVFLVSTIGAMFIWLLTALLAD